jgi:hypothetical protein
MKKISRHLALLAFFTFAVGTETSVYAGFSGSLSLLTIGESP